MISGKQTIIWLVITLLAVAFVIPCSCIEKDDDDDGIVAGEPNCWVGLEYEMYLSVTSFKKRYEGFKIKYVEIQKISTFWHADKQVAQKNT